MDLLATITLVLATVVTGMVAGLFFAFSVAVMPGGKKADDRSFVVLTQRTNAAILNPWFAATFGGAPVLLVLATLLHLGAGPLMLILIIGALMAYLAMLIITFRINQPLNKGIEAAGDVDKIDDLGAVRNRFEGPWSSANDVRTVLSVLSLALLCIALALK